MHGGLHAERLVERDVDEVLVYLDADTVDANDGRLRVNPHALTHDDLAVDLHAALIDEFLRHATRRYAGLGQHLLQTHAALDVDGASSPIRLDVLVTSRLCLRDVDILGAPGLPRSLGLRLSPVAAPCGTTGAWSLVFTGATEIPVVGAVLSCPILFC